MAPSPQEAAVVDQETRKAPITRPLKGDEVVISGMSGIFPSSDSTKEFMENIYNKVDMVTSDNPRWKFDHPEVPKHLGKVNGMGKFDAQFFRVHYKQGCTMEPMSRKLLEHAYSAIYDSGINPLQLRGKKVGVFIGSTFSESEKIVIYENIQRNGFGITGCNKAMYANRISYWIDGKGPSYALDLACVSSMACLEHAYRAISTGQCEAAIVGGCNLCMHPNVSLNLRRAGYLCLDGKTKCFDKNGDGYVRSDAISVLFLQKAKDAKRIYSEVYHAKISFSMSPSAELLPIRESKDIIDFLTDFYSEINVSPSEVEYIEANAAAIARADGNELEAIGNIFGKEKPIKVGSVKSNMGHSEPASGVCALTKVCIAYHKGVLPANLHYYEPQDHISSVRDGRIQVVQEHVLFNRGYTALNSFSYSGANIHVLLKGHYKPKDPERYKTSIPRLVLVSGRQDESLTKIFDALKSQPIDPEQIALLHSIHGNDIPGHTCRGYIVLDTNENKETVCLSEKVAYSPGVKVPIWFLYSGMGSQWATMGAELMRIPIFAAAIQRCHNVLEPKGVDIIKILTDPDKTIYDNILNSFVGIAAVQIGLTDILKAMGIVPDNIIGHSVGELGCAYADGCFTPEEMILSAYSRGLVSVQTKFIRGSMAAVGLGYKNIIDMCPPEIEVACRNSSESSTISGPADIMKKFVTELTSKGIFAKEVPCSNIAYHSRYIADAGPGLLKYLSEVIKDPKPRSEKWVSTSVPQGKWDEPNAKYSSAEYHTNNLLNPVLFEETAKLIPEDALVIEIAPHGLLQAIVKRSHSSCAHVPLTRRGHSNPVQFLLEAIGKLYQEGLNPKVEMLYPQIEFPVSTETPFLSHFVEWVHNEEWPQAKYNSCDRITSIARDFVMSIHDDDYKYLTGHVRDGVLAFPESAMLVLVWETLAMKKGIDYRRMSVIFNDIQFYGEASIRAEEPLRFGIMIHKGNNKFEVSHEGVKIVSGSISEYKGLDINIRNLNAVKDEDNKEVILTSDDVYKLMELKGFSYQGEFRSILSSNTSRTKANVKKTSTDQWITLIDSLIQFYTFSKDYDGVSTPKVIKRLTINTDIHSLVVQAATDENKPLTAEINKFLEIIGCGGIEIDTILYNNKPKRELEPDFIENGSFIPHFLTGDVDMDTAIIINLQVIADNVTEKEIEILEIVNNKSTPIHNSIQEAIDKIPTATFNLNSIQSESVNFDDVESISKSNVFVISNLLGDNKRMENLYNVITRNTFVLSLEENTTKVDPKSKLFSVITAMAVQNKILVLLRKRLVENDTTIYFPVSHENKFSWVPKLQSELKKMKRVILVSDKQPYCGLIGLVKKLSKEFPNKLGLIVVEDCNAPSLNPESIIYKEQLQKNLVINVFKKEKWGGYYYIPSVKSAHLRDVKLIRTVPGDIDSVTWIEAPTVPKNSNLVQVYYTGPSLRDAHKAVGKVINDDNSFGMDFSGIDNSGNKVMGIISRGSIASTVSADPDMLWPVPEHWSLEDAATVPLPYVHAYYCLASSEHSLLKNNNVFVSGGAGAFGQAIISLCLSLNCTVYTTVNDIRKKEFLLKLFPQLKEKNIGSSRDDSFYNMVIQNTSSKRCDHVINSYSGALRESSMKCVALSGIFHDVSDFDMQDNKPFGMYFLSEEKNYHAHNLSNLFLPQNLEQRKQIQLKISNGIATGAVRPISRLVYSPADVCRAFRLLASGNHRGRVLLKMRDTITMSKGLSVKPIMNYSSKGSYIVICDETELGIELIDRLLKRGAKNVIINLRSKSFGGYFTTKMLSWNKIDASIKILSENLQIEKGCENLLREGEKMGPIRGIFIVQDSIMQTSGLDQDEFSTKFNETALIVANLDFLSRNVCNELSHFVVLSKHSNNVVDEYAVSVNEKICRSRNEIGLPALVFHLYDFDHNLGSSQSGVKPQTVSAVLNALKTSLKLQYNNVVTLNSKKQYDSKYLQKISKILGGQLNDIAEYLSLTDLLNDVNLEEIKSVLSEELNIIYSTEKVRNMTVAELKKLGEHLSKNTKFDGGLGAFYTYIDQDECLATEPMVAMPTKLSNATEKEEELDTKAAYLFLIPGFEGHHQIFTPICERLKIQAMCLQLGPDVDADSIPQIATNIMSFIKKRFELKSKFYLLGYSFGVNVALELAALIEKEGHVGIVYCLDSSPDVLRDQLDAYVGNLTDAEMQNTLVEHMYKLMSGQESEALKKDLAELETWPEKVEACVNRLRGLVKYSHQYKRSILETAYKRLKLVREYTPSFVLESELVLMRGIPHPKAQKLPEDYNLSKYTKQPVRIFDLKSDHAISPFDCRVSNIINSLLDKSILDEFRNKSACETYLSNPFKFL